VADQIKYYQNYLPARSPSPYGRGGEVTYGERATTRPLSWLLVWWWCLVCPLTILSFFNKKKDHQIMIQ